MEGFVENTDTFECEEVAACGNEVGRNIDDCTCYDGYYLNVYYDMCL